MFEGVYTAIITPFRNDRIDYDSYFQILEKQIQGGVDGVVPCGTTGESPTLSPEEHSEFIRETVQFVKKRIKVVAGTGSNSTREAIHLTENAVKDGVDGILSVNPYYNKPTQEGLYQHFWTIAEHANVPVMLYNIPGRTSVSLTAETIQRLAEHKNIQGLKEATGDLSQAPKILRLTNHTLDVLSGDDILTLPILSVGGKGVVSVASNLFPKTMVAMVNAFREGKLDQAQELFYDLVPVFQYAFLETNPIPIKAAMNWMGYCSDEIRLPMTKLTESENSKAFQKLLQNLKERGFE